MFFSCYVSGECWKFPRINILMSVIGKKSRQITNFQSENKEEEKNDILIWSYTLVQVFHVHVSV